MVVYYVVVEIKKDGIEGEFIFVFVEGGLDF